MAECYTNDKLIRDYSEFQKKYDLPNFKELAEDFEVDKITEKEPLFLLKEVRKVVSEKITSYLALFEHFLNPSSSPMFIFSAMKNSDGDLKPIINSSYREIARLEIESMKLDTVYNEKHEAEFIKKSYVQWQSLKKKIYMLLEKIENGLNKVENSNTTSYYG